MLVLSLSVLLLLLLFHGVSSVKEKEKQCQSSGEVIPIDRHNFYDLVQPRKDKWLLYFHAPWCVECKELDSVLKSVAEQGAGKFFVGSIDGGEDVWLRTVFGLRRYPSFKVAYKERMYSYPVDGIIDEEYLFEFVDETFVKAMARSEPYPEK